MSSRRDRPGGASRRAGRPLAAAARVDRGSQSLEMALALPLLAALGVVLVLLAGIAVDLLRVQHLAREAARAAVLDVELPSPDDTAITIRRGRDGLVRAEVRLHHALPGAFGGGVWLTAHAAMVDEP